MNYRIFLALLISIGSVLSSNQPEGLSRGQSIGSALCTHVNYLGLSPVCVFAGNWQEMIYGLDGFAAKNVYNFDTQIGRFIVNCATPSQEQMRRINYIIELKEEEGNRALWMLTIKQVLEEAVFLDRDIAARYIDRELAANQPEKNFCFACLRDIETRPCMVRVYKEEGAADEQPTDAAQAGASSSGQ